MTFEGERGTWSHCGSRSPHGPHTHTVYMNEGPHSGVVCAGTPKPVVVPMEVADERTLASLLPGAEPLEEEPGCPVCAHERAVHEETGCIHGWEYGPQGGPYVKEGCDCRITGWVT